MNFNKGFPFLFTLILGAVATIFFALAFQSVRNQELKPHSTRFEFRTADVGDNNIYIKDLQTGKEYLGIRGFGTIPLELENPWIYQK